MSTTIASLCYASNREASLEIPQKNKTAQMSSYLISNKINSYKHIVLVDDVITTGSTLESIIHAIRKKNPDILISVVTLAVA